MLMLSGRLVLPRVVLLIYEQMAACHFGTLCSNIATVYYISTRWRWCWFIEILWKIFCK